jgi:hypothetical protein
MGQSLRGNCLVTASRAGLLLREHDSTFRQRERKQRKVWYTFLHLTGSQAKKTAGYQQSKEKLQNN